MSEEGRDLTGLSYPLLFIIFSLVLITGQIAAGVSLQTDLSVLLQLKDFLQKGNQFNRCHYAQWNESDPSPCNWTGITCDNDRVTGIDLRRCYISGEMFSNFSQLTELSHLDLSENTIGGFITPDLNQCKNLRYLNLSRNILGGELNLSGLSSLETLDLNVNRFSGGIQSNFPGICKTLVTLNISTNNFSGQITNLFDGCSSLKYLDLSSNEFIGEIWLGFSNMKEFSVSENNLTGTIAPETFLSNCSLEILDVSSNDLHGKFPDTISNCKNLTSLNLWGNNFTGVIPPGIGSLPELNALYLGSNRFNRSIPGELLNCSKLAFLDLSKNNFGGEIQEIFGKFTQVEFLVLHTNSYTGGINSSGILKLPRVSRLDLSYNNFSGPLPVEIVQMPKLRFLILAYNNFSGNIPAEFGQIPTLQALDLSFNNLTGSIPPSIGNLTSLLWLMLANNNLDGEIPPEIGNCSSLLWLNLADNRLSGKIPLTISEMGKNPHPTFEMNRINGGTTAGSGECLSMKRWLPATYPPFSFVYSIMTRKNCQITWDRLLKGFGIFPICVNHTSPFRTLTISGYLQLTGNRLSGEIPPGIGRMQKLSLIHLNLNQLSGRLPPEISNLPLVVLNVSFNNLSGQIPPEIGSINCLQNLDLSSNNFSGNLPVSLNNLTEVSKFNVSYNPLLAGLIPISGQLSTFDRNSFIGDPLIVISAERNGSSSQKNSDSDAGTKGSPRIVAFWVFLALSVAFFVAGVLSLIACLGRGIRPSDADAEDDLLKRSHDVAVGSTSSSSSSSSSLSTDTVKVFRLDKTAFTYPDIVTATRNFSDDMVIGSGGFGVVYRGVLPDGRHVAVKKLRREGKEGEREFRAEMEVLSGGDVGWPHSNLVTLFGWCLFGSEKLLVYEYMEGGSLEELIADWSRLGWARRVDVAVGVARALVFLHHECFPAVVHRDVKASNVLLDGEGKARVTDFGLARVVGPGDSHVSTMVAGTVGYVAPEYGQTWQATTKGDVYSFGVVAMELATGRRAVDGGEECLVEWVRRVSREGWQGLKGAVVPVMLPGTGVGEEGVTEGLVEMCELLRIGMRCAVDSPQARPNMKEVLAMLIRVSRDSLGRRRSDCGLQQPCC